MPNKSLIELEQIKAFEKAYSAYLHKVEYYAFSFVNNIEEAKNIAQDTFAKLWEKRDELDFEKELLPYLFVLAKNICLNTLRREIIKNKHQDFTLYRANMFNINVLESPSADKVLHSEVQRLINIAYSNMPEKVKETFILSRDKHLKNKEIAQLLGIGISTVEFRLSCAFKIFRKYLKDYLPFLLWFLPPIV